MYLCQGRVGSEFAGIQMGVAENLRAAAVAEATGSSAAQARASLRRTGDLGTTAEQLLARRVARRLAGLGAGEVFKRPEEIATISGAGAQERRLTALVGLIRRAVPLEARYLVRTVTGTLRLGIGDATILDALAASYAGGRQRRPALDRAHNICSDLGLVAAMAARGGLRALAPSAFIPGGPSGRCSRSGS